MNLAATANKPIQFQIVEFIDKNTKLASYKEATFNSKCHYMFSNFRMVNRTPTGLRLTNKGYKLLNRFFDSYEFETNEDLTGSILLALDKNLKWPYYIDNRRIIFYSQEDAAWFKLGGTIVYFTSSL